MRHTKNSDKKTGYRNLPGPRTLFYGATIIVLAFLVPSCGLLLDLTDGPIVLPVPHEEVILECSVVVRSQAVGSVLGEQSFELPLTSLSGDFLAPDGSPLRRYTSSDSCPEGTVFNTPEEAEEDWRLFVQQRIDSLASEEESASILGIFPETWCEVPGTLTCTELFRFVTDCEALQLLTNTVPLPTCDPLPPEPGDPCLAVTCGENSPCSEIDFGDVLVNDTTPKQVTLSNCGEPGDAIVEVTVDGTVVPQGQRSDFDIPVAENACHPVNGNNEILELPLGESCTLTVVFNPGDPGDHSGTTTFTSNARAEPFTIVLAGNAGGGSLSYSVPDLIDPTQIPDLLCVDDLIDGTCTTVRQLDVLNQGPGGVHIDDVRLINAQGFELVNTPPLLENINLGANESTSFPFRWCGSNELSELATLVINSNDPGQPTFLQTLVREPDGCQPVCGDGVSGPGEMCDDGNTVDGDGCSFNCTVEFDPDLMAAYGFEGLGSAMQDVTGNGFDGLLQVPAVRNSGGRFGAGIEFNGIGGHIVLPSNLDISGDQLTIALWLKADDFVVNFARLIAKELSTNLADTLWMLSTVNNNALRFSLNTGVVNNLVPANDLLVVDVWTHVAGVYDGANMLLYKDGEQIASLNTTGGIQSDPSRPVWIGDSPQLGTRSFDGIIDEVRIYSRALGAQEIQEIMNTALIPP